MYQMVVLWCALNPNKLIVLLKAKDFACRHILVQPNYTLNVAHGNKNTCETNIIFAKLINSDAF